MVGPPHTKAHSGWSSGASWSRPTEPLASLSAVTASFAIFLVLIAPSAIFFVTTAFFAILGVVTAPLARSLLVTRLPATPGAVEASSARPATATAPPSRRRLRRDGRVWVL